MPCKGGKNCKGKVTHGEKFCGKCKFGRMQLTSSILVKGGTWERQQNNLDTDQDTGEIL